MNEPHRRFSMVAVAALSVASSAAAQQDRTAAAGSAQGLPVCEAVARGLYGVVAGQDENVSELRAALAAAGDSAGAIPILHPDSTSLRLVNQAEVRRVMRRNVHRALRQGHADGGVQWMVLRVDENGNVVDVNPVAGSMSVEFTRWTVGIGRAMRFTPAQYGGCRIPVLLRMPIAVSRSGP